jgi:hypothetical protein
MTPVDWLKTLYGWVGANHPKASFVGVVVLSAVLGGIAWRFAAYVYAKDHSIAAPGQPSTVSTTTGTGSPILPNNSGSVTINGDGSKSEESAPEGKPK